MNNQTQLGVASKFSAILMAGAAIAALSFATPALAVTPVLSSACSTSTGATGSTSWTPASASSWFTAANWDHGVPLLATPQTNVNVSGGTAQISTSAANAGTVLNLCNGTVDVQTGGSLTAGSIAVGASGTLLLSGSTGLTVADSIYLDGGLLRDAFTGTLSSNIVVGDTATKSGTISVAAGKILTDTGSLSFGVNSANLVFGSSSDTGTFIYAPTTFLLFSPFAPAIDSYEVAGGTLQAGNDGLGNLLAPLGISTKVDSGATLDFNGHFAEVNNLTGAGHVISSTTLTIDSGQFSGVISGAGKLVKDSLCNVTPPPSTTCTNNTLILSGTNIYSGGTQINDGTLQIGNGGTSGSITGNIVNDDTLAIDRSDTFILLGNISGFGKLQQIGTGNTVLNGTNTYSGTTTVSAGTLTVEGSIDNSSVTVSSGGILSGSGSVGATTIASGGTIAPGGIGGVGSGIGTLTTGALTLSSGSEYLAAVTPTLSSLLDVQGTATIGGLFGVTANSHPDATKTYTVLESTGNLTGTFTLAPGAAGAYMPHLAYDLHHVFLHFTLINFSSLLPTAATTNQKAAFAAIDAAIAHGDTLPAAFSSLTSLSQPALVDAATQLSGELGSDLPRLTASEVNPFLNVLMNEPGNLDTDLGTRHGRKARLWGSFFGGGGNTTGDDTIGSHSLSDHVFGFATGLDLLLTPSFLTGIAVAGSQTNFTLADQLGSGHDTAIELGLFATKRLGHAAYVSFAGAYALQSATTSRTLTQGTTSFELAGKVSPKTAAGRFEAGYRFGRRFGLTPYVAVQYDRFNAPAYTETGNTAATPLALSYAAHTTPTTSFEVGTGLDYSSISSRNASLHLYGRVAYQHSNASESTADVAFSTMPHSTFTVQGTAAGANAALLAFGAEMRGKNGLSLGIKANGALSQGAKDYFATGNIGYSW